MSESLADIIYSSIYNDFEMVISSMYFVVAISATILTSFVLIASFYKQNNPGTLLLSSLCCADFLFSFTASLVTFTNLYHRRFAIGDIACRIDGAIVCFSCSISIMSLLFMSLERCKSFCSYLNRFERGPPIQFDHTNGMDVDDIHMDCFHSIWSISVFFQFI
jgi:hypothetical protein